MLIRKTKKIMKLLIIKAKLIKTIMNSIKINKTDGKINRNNCTQCHKQWQFQACNGF